MPTDTEVEEKLRQLEAEVKARQPPPKALEIPSARPTANLAAREPKAYVPSSAETKKPVSWKTKLVVGAALVVGGLIAVSLVWKVVKLAFYGAALVAIIGGGYWLWRKYFKKK
jgi:hypothetical protein